MRYGAFSARKPTTNIRIYIIKRLYIIRVNNFFKFNYLIIRKTRKGLLVLFYLFVRPKIVINLL